MKKNLSNIPAGEFEIVVKTFRGLEELLAAEINALTGKKAKILHRAVAFRGDMVDLYRANYFLNTAVRVLRTLAVVPAADKEQLYMQVKNYSWENIFSVVQSLKVEVSGASDAFNNTRYAAQLVKDAVADRFREKTGKRPNVDLESPDIRIHVMLQGGRAVISLDSSGESLHLRGYRSEQVEAPLNEVLASALVLFSGWDRKSTFIDPMCGSGTILLEAARIAMNIAPGYRRRKYAFSRWRDFNPERWEKVIEEGAVAETKEAPLLLGADISAEAVEMTARNAERAGLRRHIRLATKAFSQLSKPGPKGMLIMNPPYGERLKLEDQAKFYAEIGDVLKQKFTGYQAWIFTSNKEALKSLGLRTARRLSLQNGPLESYFYRYDLYPGSRKFGDGSGEEEEL